jgi:hypothetical protein
MRNSLFHCCLVTTMLVTLATRGAAQQDGLADSARIQIRQTLRAFYFNLARGDWEALTSDILAAKVVAHRTPPVDPVPAAASTACEKTRAPLIDRSSIELEGEWARVLVPRCLDAVALGDRFRLINFEGRWRFVSIDLREGPVKLWAER